MAENLIHFYIDFIFSQTQDRVCFVCMVYFKCLNKIFKQLKYISIYQNLADGRTKKNSRH